MQRSDLGVAIRLFLFFLFTYWLTGGGHFYASDDVQKLAVLQAVFHHGTIAIPGGWVQGFGALHYSWFPLGASLLMLPGYAVGSLASHLFPMLPAEYALRFCVSLENAVFSSALVALVFLYTRWLGRSAGGSAFAAIALGLGTMVWPYAKTAWSEPGATLLVFAGLFALQHARRIGLAQAGRYLWITGGTLALAAFVRQEMVLIALGAFAWLGWGERPRWTQALPLVVPFLLVGILTLWYDQTRFGALFTFPNYRLPQQNLTLEEGRFGWSLKNLYQYTFSPNQGLFWFSPALWLGLLGLGRISRTGPLKLFAAALLPLALFYVYGWGLSSWAWGLRYSYVFVPFLILPAAALWETASRRRGWMIAWLALAAAVQLLGVLHDPNQLYEAELKAHPGLTIQKLMTNSGHSPLTLALEATPATLENGWRLVHGAPSGLTRESYRDRRSGMPDLWFVLQLLSPMPRLATAGALGLLSLGWLAALVSLLRALGRKPASWALSPTPIPAGDSP